MLDRAGRRVGPDEGPPAGRDRDEEAAPVAERIGFIGLGIMGRPMARNLLRAGFELTVYNRTPARAVELASEGAAVAGSPAEAAGQAGIVLTMLPGPPEVRSVVAGDGGVLAGARPGTLVVDLSTSSPALARELAARAAEAGVGMLDAPVSGGPEGAEQGSLSIMVGGQPADVDRARPVFDALGSTVVHVGGHGAGQVTKACNQIVVALLIQAVSEALVLGAKAGVDPAAVLRVLSGGLAANRLVELRAGKLLDRDFRPGGKATFHHKDLGIALATARELDVALPATALVDQLFAALDARGQGELDHLALLTLVEDLAAHRIRG
jgi:2-hydroxy-3-oxopropionate reductase